MGVTDPIADLLTRIRNGSKAGKKWVDVPASGLKKELVKILSDEHFVGTFSYKEDNKQGNLRIILKYDANEKPIIQGIKRISKPGLRIYTPSQELKRVYNGLGIAIISTSSGVMTDRDARKKGVGGEILCYVW
jgi:small subunit ribosomal protein S8